MQELEVNHISHLDELKNQDMEKKMVQKGSEHL
jgi:hypothetical protein